MKLGWRTQYFNPYTVTDGKILDMLDSWIYSKTAFPKCFEERLEKIRKVKNVLKTSTK